MAFKNWQVINVRYCHHVNDDVGLEAQIIYPAEIMPEMQPRVAAHRCTRALACNLDGRSSCIWAGTNPSIDPFGDPD